MSNVVPILRIFYLLQVQNEQKSAEAETRAFARFLPKLQPNSMHRSNVVKTGSLVTYGL